MSISNYDFSDLHKYPNVGLLRPNESKVGKLRYGRNYFIRSANQKLAFTKEAREVRDYFFTNPSAEKMIEMFETYGRIMQVGKGIKPFKFWQHQIDYIHYLFENKEMLVLMGRRLSKSTTFLMFAMYTMLSNDGYDAGVGVNNDKLLKASSKAFKQIFEYLPPFLQRGVKLYNQSQIILDNDSSLEFGIISGDLFRGQAKDLINIDEIDFADGAEDVFDSIDAIISESPSVKLCITTTPNGKRIMHRLWNNSIKGKNDFVRFKRTWECRPDRDQAWADRELAKKGEINFNRNHLVSFEGSSKTLISTFHMRKIEDESLTDNFNPFIDDERIRIYQEPIVDRNIFYFIGCDTSKATEVSDEISNDALAFHVIKFDVLNMNFSQVAVMNVFDTHYTEISQMLFDVGNYYHDMNNESALIIIENNEGSGQSIADNLANVLDYDNVFYQKANITGARTDKKTRPIMLSNIKKLIENDILTIVDRETHDQFSTFVQIKDKYQASNLKHDDLVMSLAIGFAWLLDENNVFEVTMNEILLFHKRQDKQLIERIVLAREENNTNDLPMLGNYNDELADLQTSILG